MTANRHFANHLAKRFTKLMGGEATSGIFLILVAAAAIAVANSAWEPLYHAVLHGPMAWTPVSHLPSLHAWINDGLMAIFFLVVGLEIKREVLAGELASPAKRRLPVLAAIAGMAAPALIYLLAAGSSAPEHNGWAIPAATDIAFAVGTLALLGKRIPPSLRLFLLTVAIVDDLGAVIIIALFYTAKIDMVWAFGALAFYAMLMAANWRQVPYASVFILLGIGLWFCVLHSGIHATIAGVLLAFTIPLKVTQGDSLLLRMEHALTPWNAYVIVPLFGFANAGVALSGMGLEALLDPVPLGVALGLCVGKQTGIFGAIVLAERTGFATKPAGASWAQLWGMSVLCGIGFTMSLFIAALAFPQSPHLVEEAKLGVLLGSFLSAVLGYAILRLAKGPDARSLQ